MRKVWMRRDGSVMYAVSTLLLSLCSKGEVEKIEKGLLKEGAGLLFEKRWWRQLAGLE